MKLFLKIFAWIGGDETVKVAHGVRGPNRAQNILDGVARAKGDTVILKELNRIGDETAFCHGKKIVEGLQALLAICGAEGSL